MLIIPESGQEGQREACEAPPCGGRLRNDSRNNRCRRSADAARPPPGRFHRCPRGHPGPQWFVRCAGRSGMRGRILRCISAAFVRTAATVIIQRAEPVNQAGGNPGVRGKRQTEVALSLDPDCHGNPLPGLPRFLCGRGGLHISAVGTGERGTRMSIRSRSAPPTLRQYLWISRSAADGRRGCPFPCSRRDRD